MQRTVHSSSGGWLPSTSARSGIAGSRSTARRMASRAAWRILMRHDLADRGGADADFDFPRPARLHQGRERRSRSSAVSFLELSSRPASDAGHPPRQHHGGSEHRAGERPRPASSTPAMRPRRSRHGSDE